MAENVTQKELAELLGVSEAAVSKAVKAGRIQREEDGKINSEKAVRQWNTGQRMRSKSAINTDELTTDLLESRARKEAAAADVAEMEAAARRGDLLPKKDAVHVFFTATRIFRDGLRNQAAKLSGQLAAESDPVTVERILMESNMALLADFFSSIKAHENANQ